MDIDLRCINDGRNIKPEAYETNFRMGTFTGSWNNPKEEGGVNSWAHAGGFCREQFGQVEDGNWTMHERRLVFLGMLVAYVNGDRCANWTDEQRKKALKDAWEHIESERPRP